MPYRKCLHPILLCVAVILSHGFDAIADPSHYNYIVSSRNATVTGYKGPGGDIVIPDTLGGRPVNCIDFYAFDSVTSITRVTFPTNLRFSIREGAFCFCSNLVGVDLPDSLVLIGEGAFSQCKKLSEITLSTNLTSIGPAAFAGCNSLTNLALPASLHHLGSSAFYCSTNLVSVTLPAGLTTIEYHTFDGCTSLASIEIPDSVTSIGFSAFEGCASLTSVTIPARVASMGSYVFTNCTRLKSLYFMGTPPTLIWFGSYGTPATVYYLPAQAAQWPSTYADLPTLCWNPVIGSMAAPSFTAPFSFTIAGTTNIPVAVETRTDLAAGTWEHLLTTNIPPAGIIEFSDSAAADHPTRFYRIVAP